MDSFWQDIRYAFRKLIRNPGFTAVAVLALGLGIGANTSIFSVVNAVLIRPLPFAEPERLVVLWENNPERGRESVAAGTYRDWKEGSRTVEEMAAWAYWSHTLTGVDEPERVRTIRVTSDLFSVLGVDAALGRTLSPDEDQPGRDKVVVLSHGFWERRFAGDRGVIGRTVTLNGEPYAVVGVMPRGFRFPDEEGIDMWLPAAFSAEELNARPRRMFNAIGRLAPGATIEQARAELGGISAGIAEQYPDTNTGWGVAMTHAEDLVIDSNRYLLIMLGAVAFVLLIACANVANLLLARAADREKEIAIRRALGAGRIGLVRQLLVESLLLAALGGGLALLISVWGVDLIIALEPGNIPGWNSVGIDGNVLMFTGALALITALIAGLVPAIHSSKPDLGESLKEGSGKFTAGSGQRRARNLLVVSEIALAVVLLIGAGLLIRSFARLQNVDPGFNPNNVLSASIFLPGQRYEDGTPQVDFFRELVERVQNLPGVVSAGASTGSPMNPVSHDFDLPFNIEGQPAHEPGKEPQADWRSITPDYLSTMGIPVLRGRALTHEDRNDAPRVILVNETMARRFFSDTDPVGKRMRIPFGGWHEIIGVVGDVRHRGLDSEPRPEMYVSYLQTPFSGMVLAVRTAGEPNALVRSVRRQVFEIDPELAIARVASMPELLSGTLARRRFNMTLLGTFAGLALVLAAIGIYGVISYAVSQRTKEIGVRIAMGAGRDDVVRMVVRQGLVLAAIGVGIGVSGGFILTRLLSSLLYEVSPRDPLTFVGVPLVLVAAALAASYIPAIRATRVDPVMALRQE